MTSPSYSKLKRDLVSIRPREAGFTIIELVIVMGLLAAFMLMLVQLMNQAMGLFTAGEKGQDLADRLQAATRAVTTTVDDMVGPKRDVMGMQDVDARLIVTWEPLGWKQTGAAGKLQVLRSTVRISEAQENALLIRKLRVEVEEKLQGEEAIARRVQELLAETPRLGRAQMLFTPWPRDKEGTFLELRRGLFLEGEDIEPLEIAKLGSRDLPPATVPLITRAVAQGLLHIEFEFWSQLTTDWQRLGDGGPEYVWDSARAGLFLDAQRRRERFTLDLGETSLRDPRDDVFPQWIRTTMVVAQGKNAAADSTLMRALSADATDMVLNSAEVLDEEADLRFVKVDAEWISYKAVSGDRLTGLKRGQRGSIAKEHSAGSGVWAGRTTVVVRRLLHGRDAWND